MVGESVLSRTYGPLLSTTLDHILGSGAIADNVFDATPLLQYLRSGDRVKVIDGGERIRVGIRTGSNGTFQWYSDYEQLNTTPVVGQTTAFEIWKQGSVSVSISGLELRSNMGKAKITSLMDEKVAQARDSLVDSVATGTYSDGTGSTNKQLTGLQAMIATDPTTGTYMSINSANNTNWRNRVTTGVGAAAANLVSNMRSLYNSCARGKAGAAGSPDFIAMPQTIHEAYESLMVPMLRFSSLNSRPDLGAGDLLYKGARVALDQYCTSGVIYMLTGANLCFFIHKDANFAMADEGFQKPINQDALVTQILLQGNLATDNRRKQGKLTGIT